jgi:hypothetical protein
MTAKSRAHKALSHIGFQTIRIRTVEKYSRLLSLVPANAAFRAPAQKPYPHWLSAHLRFDRSELRGDGARRDVAPTWRFRENWRTGPARHIASSRTRRGMPSLPGATLERARRIERPTLTLATLGWLLS